MIEFTPTTSMLRAMSLAIARHRLRRFSFIAVPYSVFLSFLLFWSMVNSDGAIYVWEWAMLATTATLLMLLMIALFLALAYTMTLRRTKEAYQTLGLKHITYNVGKSALTATMGQSKSTISYDLIKDTWQTKRFIYFWIKGGTVFGLPKSEIGSADMEKLAQYIPSVKL